MTPREFVEEHRSKHFLVCGLGVSGRAFIRWAAHYNLTFSIFDEGPLPSLLPRHEDAFDNLPELGQSKNIYSKKDSEENAIDWTEITDVILSPGFPRRHSFLDQPQKNHLPIWNEVDFFYPLLQSQPQPYTIVAITGTDGKSTTVHLLAHLLQGHYSQVLTGGNNGIPIAEIFEELGHPAKDKIIILEFSSYMAEKLYQFRPHFSTVLNLSPDHLDRYGDFEDYARSKYSLIRFTTPEDTFLINRDHPLTASGEKFFPPEASPSLERFEVDDLPSDLRELAAHYFIHPSNLAAVHSLARLLKIKVDYQTAIPTFRSLEHRLEEIPLPQRSYRIFNDSKATTLQAVISAINSFSTPVTLIMGGDDKNISYSELKKYRKKIKEIFFYGEVGEKIMSMSEVSGTYAYDFQEVVKRAWEGLNEGDILLLSPGSSSFDQFQNFGERGRVFKELIKKLETT